jgi:hypothetical protein
MDSARRRPLTSAPGRRTASAANPGGVHRLPGERFQRQQTSPPHSERQGASSPGGIAFPRGKCDPEAEQDEKNSYIVPKGQGMTPGQCTFPARRKLQFHAEDAEKKREGAEGAGAVLCVLFPFLRALCVKRPRDAGKAPEAPGNEKEAALADRPFLTFKQNRLSRGPWRRSPRPCSWALPRTARTACCTPRGPATWSAAWCCSRTSRTAAPWR